ncbi:MULTISPECIES: histidinol-phosphate transaminase [Brevibacterium]|jgi:histidinol-phosphate aminotransferase|uniref:Histidinol-phosphate aminotransferase n=1 Tax=Brevibacterium salitolerans TaxID=1403566 RepID=A0ABN2WNH2_9MICO|nr:histidinol-phosphate transaminase [Brevibacterium sp.]
MTNFRVRPALADTPAYVPGKPPAPVEGVQSYKLSSNEHHMDPLPAALEAILGAARTPHLYPDPSAHDLTAALAAHHEVPYDNVVVSAGASEGLSALIGITAEAGTSVVFPWPSFEMYPQVVSFTGAEKIAVPLADEGRMDLPAMLQAIREDTRLVLLCSPNNPTGAVMGQAEFDTFMEQVPADVLVVLDEAYVDFAPGSEGAASIRANGAGLDAPVDSAVGLATYPNLAVLRTFSKAHGLAGLRVGYTLAQPGIIHEMRKSIAPFSVTAPAQAAAQASLAHLDEIAVRSKEVGVLRDELAARLREVGIPVPPSGGNFVWLPLGKRSQEFADACMAAGLAVRNLGAGVRVTVGPQEALDRLVDIARTFIGK